MCGNMVIDKLTEEGARALVQNPAINLVGLASKFYGDDRHRPDQALRKRVLLSEKISDQTLERLTRVVNDLLEEILSSTPRVAL